MKRCGGMPIARMPRMGHKSGTPFDPWRRLLTPLIVTLIPIARSQPSVNVAVPGFSEVFGLGQGSGTEVGLGSMMVVPACRVDR
jgi:hypothetical protein